MKSVAKISVTEPSETTAATQPPTPLSFFFLSVLSNFLLSSRFFLSSAFKRFSLSFAAFSSRFFLSFASFKAARRRSRSSLVSFLRYSLRASLVSFCLSFSRSASSLSRFSAFLLTSACLFLVRILRSLSAFFCSFAFIRAISFSVRSLSFSCSEKASPSVKFFTGVSPLVSGNAVLFFSVIFSIFSTALFSCSFFIICLHSGMYM